MWVAIIAVSVVVLALAAYAATGRLGEMPADPVLDDHPGLVPDGRIDADFLAKVRFPVRRNGYATDEVDAYLDDAVAGTAVPADEAQFAVRRSGYDMAVVDAVLDRLAAQQRDDGIVSPTGVDLESIYRHPDAQRAKGEASGHAGDA